MKKLLAFLIMLVVGMALFAMPVINDTTSLNTVETVQSVGVLATVTDVSPAIVQADNKGGMSYLAIQTSIKTNEALKAIENDLLATTDFYISPYRYEVNPLYGYSKMSVGKTFISQRIIILGRS